MFKEKIVLHGMNLVGLVKVGGSFSAWFASRNGYTLSILVVAATWFVLSNVALKKAKKRYPRFNRVCTKIRV